MPAWELVGNIKGPPGDVRTVVSRGNFFFGAQDKVNGIALGKVPGYWKAKFDGTIEGWDITVDQGLVQVAIWKIANGAVAPTSANLIGIIAITTGTSIESVDVSGFTTVDVLKGDIFGAAVVGVAGACKDFGGSIWIEKLGDAVSGGAGGGIDLVTNEVPVGAINSTNTIYTTAHAFRGNDLFVYLNGVRQRLGADYTILSTTTFTMASAPVTGDTITADYIKD
jgi:hypothetical protein